MKKTKTKSIGGIFSLLVVGTSIFGAIIIGMWIYHGIANVVETYNQVDDLSYKVDELHRENKEIIRKICANGGEGYYIKNGECVSIWSKFIKAYNK